MKPVFVSSYGPGAASTRARVHEWVRRIGLDAEIHEYLGTARLGADVLWRNAHRIIPAEVSLRQLARKSRPHVFLQRQASPLGHGRVEKAILQSARFSVYDFDDALMWEPGDGGRHRLSTSRARKCRMAVEYADVVIAGSDVLGDWASNFARDVRVIPTCIEPSDYPIKSSYSVSDPPRISWLGSPSTEIYLRELTRPLLEINRRTGARVRLVSAGTADLGPLQPIVDRVEWSLATYASAIAATDIAVAPLKNQAWSTGKCAYKMLQYAAIGLPIVASPVGANAVAGERLGAFFASGAEEWVDAITDVLTATPEERERAAKSARREVIAQYSYEAWQRDWLLAQGIIRQATLAKKEKG